MEKSITKGQNFDSFAEFDKVFKTYCDKTHQVYNRRSCRQLKIEDIRMQFKNPMKDAQMRC